MRRIAVPAPGDRRALLDVCEQLAEAPFDRSRPLWEFTVLDGLAGGRAALLQKVHHTISDGVGALRLSLAMLDLEADPAPRPEVPVEPDGDNPARGPLGVLRGAAFDATARGAHVVGHAVHGATSVLTHPTELPARAADATRLAASVHRQAFVADRAHSDILQGRSLRRHFEVHRVALPALQARRGRARRQRQRRVRHRYRGRPRPLPRSDGEHRRRTADGDAGEHTRQGRRRARIGSRRLVSSSRSNPPDDPAALFAVIHDRLATTKTEPALTALESLAGFAYFLPTSLLVAFTRSQARTIDFAASNLRGSPVPLYLAGARIVANFPFGPRSGTALNITTFGYADELHLGCNIDPAAVTDIDAFTDDLTAGFEELLELS